MPHKVTHLNEGREHHHVGMRSGRIFYRVAFKGPTLARAACLRASRYQRNRATRCMLSRHEACSAKPLTVILSKTMMGVCPNRMALVLGLTLLSAPAESQTPLWTLLGPGQVSCRSWTKERQSKSALSYVEASWVLGYLSGLNGVSVSVLKTPDFLKGAQRRRSGWMDGQLL